MFTISSPTPSIIVAAGLIWREDGYILVSRRPEGGPHAGKWELPGGKLEAGETPEDALVREIREELDLTVEPGPEFGRVEHDYPAVHVTLIGLHARYLGGEPKLLGVAETRWIKTVEIKNFVFPEANSRLFAFDWQVPPKPWQIRNE